VLGNSAKLLPCPIPYGPNGETTAFFDNGVGWSEEDRYAMRDILDRSPSVQIVATANRGYYIYYYYYYCYFFYYYFFYYCYFYYYHHYA
jgi:hypothetical protein